MKYKISLLLILLVSCTQGKTPVAVPNTNPPPPPVHVQCDIIEMEPNDTAEDAIFLGLLPDSPTVVCGDLTSLDVDVYKYFLNPPDGTTEIMFNLVTDTPDTVAPLVKFYRTRYDKNGQPEEELLLIGIFQGSFGELVILGFPIPYDFLTQNDLFVSIEDSGSSTPVDPSYVLEYWSN